MSDVYALVRSIREHRFSRNQNFDAHATAAGAEARRLHRFLLAVERDLALAEDVDARRQDGDGGGGGYTVAMSFPAVKLTRLVSLTREEHALLCEDAKLARLLGAGEPEAV